MDTTKLIASNMKKIYIIILIAMDKVPCTDTI